MATRPSCARPGTACGPRRARSPAPDFQAIEFRRASVRGLLSRLPGREALDFERGTCARGRAAGGCSGPGGLALDDTVWRVEVISCRLHLVAREPGVAGMD